MANRGAAVAAALATATGPAPLRGAAATANVITQGAIAWEDGRIVFAGPSAELPWPADHGSPGRGLLVPGFVDPHVHLPFFGWRADEYEARLRGASYRDLHGEEGGIYRSARMLASATDEEVLSFCLPLLGEMARHGTTAVELKTGYGLSVEAELRQARLARELSERSAQSCRITLLACHAVPPGMTRTDWVRIACEELIPQAAPIVDAVDIYVEDIAFSLEDLEAVATAASAAGLPLRCHADQLGPSGAAEAAVALGARSADHLNNCSDAGVEALAAARSTAAVLLPASTFFLRAKTPPVRALEVAGAAIAIATDFNPGTSPVCSMPEAVSIACALYRMEPLRALTAATLNAAWVLDLDDRLGSLQEGKRADFLLLEETGFAHVPYRPGHNPVVSTFVGGELVSGGGDLALNGGDRG
jgi:imidazolonepropionase